jgi:RNA polymerase sigma-70 factor (ECF subfamily)
MISEEEQVIAAIRSGDSSAFKKIVDHYQDMVYTICIRLVKNSMIAEELAQDSFLKAFRNIHSYRGESKFSTWLYRIAYNTCLSSFRKNTVDEIEFQDYNADSQENDGLKSLETEDRDLELKRLLVRLKEDEQLLIQLFYLEELSIKEIADVVGMTESNIKVKLHRSKQKLKEFIEFDFPELRRNSA